MTLQPLTVKKFSTDRKSFKTFSFKQHLKKTELLEQYNVKDKKYGGQLCSFSVSVEGQPTTRLQHMAYFTSGLELNTGDIAAKLAQMAAANPGGAFVFEIYEL